MGPGVGRQGLDGGRSKHRPPCRQVLVLALVPAVAATLRLRQLVAKAQGSSTRARCQRSP